MTARRTFVQVAGGHTVLRGFWGTSALRRRYPGQAFDVVWFVECPGRSRNELDSLFWMALAARPPGLDGINFDAVMNGEVSP
jgi:hypothetical protein